MKNQILRLIRSFFPELSAGTLIPRLAVVIAIPDAPANGEKNTPDRPRYAVNVKILTPDGDPDPAFPELRDVPLALPCAGNARGLTGIPQVGTIVELAFAFGMQTKPFIRSILPYGLTLPATDSKSMRFQQTADVYMEFDVSGNLNTQTPENMVTNVGKDVLIYGSHLWFGSLAVNTLQLLSGFMAQTSAALSTLASHNHPHPLGPTSKSDSCAADLPANQSAIESLKSSLDTIKK